MEKEGNRGALVFPCHEGNEGRDDPAEEFQVLPTQLAQLDEGSGENDNFSGNLATMESPSKLLGRVRGKGIQIQGLPGEFLKIFDVQLGRDG